jgi:hypothetical protein
MSIAIQALENAKAELTAKFEREIAEVERAIEQCKNSANGFPRWQGMSMRGAAHAYLSDYDGPVPFEELLCGLQARGVRLGDPAKPQRFQANLKTMVVNNPTLFRYDKRKDTVMLISELVVAKGPSAANE